MMMTIASAKRGPDRPNGAHFHQWTGIVLRKIKGASEWQPIFIRLTKTALKCYQNEVK